MAANGFDVRALPADEMGRVVVEDLAGWLGTWAPSVIHLTVVASHRGIVQPLQEVASICRGHGVPVVVDAAQGLGHVDCAVESDAIYASSRKWLAGPRGVGVLAVRPDLARRLRPRLPPADWDLDIPPLRALQLGEANVAARVGFSVAILEHMACDPATVRAGLVDAGRLTRSMLSDLPGWRVVEPVDSPTAITTLAPIGDIDVTGVRAGLIAEHAIVTTAAGPDRAPFELSGPVLRVSPHVDVTEEDLTTFVRALGSL
jgi:pyridoxal 5-phosphate dependent beta-lyase